MERYYFSYKYGKFDKVINIIKKLANHLLSTVDQMIVFVLRTLNSYLKFIVFLAFTFIIISYLLAGKMNFYSDNTASYLCFGNSCFVSKTLKNEELNQLKLIQKKSTSFPTMEKITNSNPIN